MPQRAATDATYLTPDDPHFSSHLTGTNHRFPAAPDAVAICATPEQVRTAVQHAVDAGGPLGMRSGGHGFECGGTAPEGGVLLDLSELTGTGWDPEASAFVVGAGTRLGELYRTLARHWGVTVPGGECPEVGVGGHFAGGGYGPLSRSLGSVVDYIEAVEVVTVDVDGRAALVRGSSDPQDPHHELWWAHTGGGAGSLGVVTRYWLRSPDAPEGAPPEQSLPQAPGAWRKGFLLWPWAMVDRELFEGILTRFTGWLEENSAPDSPERELSVFLHTSHHTEHGVMVGVGTPDVDGSQSRVDAFFDAVAADLPAPPVRAQATYPWLYSATYPNWGDPGDIDTRRIKIKAAYHRRGFTPAQVDALWEELTAPEHTPVQLLAIGYGGRVNAVDPGATALAQRDSVMKLAFMSTWADPGADERNIEATRRAYRRVYEATGGVPVCDGRTDGAYVNYADTDLADPALNGSDHPWSRLYFKDNYPRLQEAKAVYDPKDRFRHALTVEHPGDVR